MAYLWNFLPLGDYIVHEESEMQDLQYLLNAMGRAQFHKAILYGAVIGEFFGLAQACVNRTQIQMDQLIRNLQSTLPLGTTLLADEL